MRKIFIVAIATILLLGCSAFAAETTEQVAKKEELAPTVPVVPKSEKESTPTVAPQETPAPL